MPFVLKDAPGLPKEFEIEFVKLKDGQHHFQGEIGIQFFEYFENIDVKGAQVDVQLEIDKQQSLIQVELFAKGYVSVTCDRCLELVNMPVDTQYLVLYQFTGEVAPDVDKDNSEVEFIELPANAVAFNVSQQVYETVLLDIPMIRNCDDLETKPCNSQMLEKLNNINQSGDEKSDPRWDKLKDLLK